MDIIESVKAAEDAAEGIRSAARAEAQKLLTEAEKAARAEAQKLLSDAKIQGEAFMTEALKRADTATAKAEAELEKKKEELIATAKRNNAKAVDKIISLV